MIVAPAVGCGSRGPKSGVQTGLASFAPEKQAGTIKAAMGQMRERISEALYESGRSTVRVRLPDEAAERFRAVVKAAEAILEVASEPEPASEPDPK